MGTDKPVGNPKSLYIHGFLGQGYSGDRTGMRKRVRVWASNPHMPVGKGIDIYIVPRIIF